MVDGKSNRARSGRSRSEHASLVQIWVPKEDVVVIKQAAKCKSVPMSVFIRTSALEAARLVDTSCMQAS